MSRLLHTSDWHLGHSLYGHTREEDFDAVLAEIVDIARESRPDLIVHSGDLFHTSRPTVLDLLRAMCALYELCDVAPTVVVAGNHDSPGYFEFLNLVSGPSRGKGLFFVDRVRSARETVFSFDACGGKQRIRLAAMPFVHPNRFWPASSTSGMTPADYAEGMRGLQAELMEALREGYDPDRDVLLFAAHVYIAGTTRSPSERAVHEAFEVPAADLPEVSYVALGHIHRPGPVPPGLASAAHYAGSPLPMDFGEANDAKSVVIVDADPGRQAKPTPRRLSSGRRLANFTGTLEELKAASAQYDGTFLKADITGEEPGTLLTREVSEIVPKAILVGPVRARGEAADAALDEVPADEPDLPDAFRAYLEREGMSSAAAAPTVSAFTQLLNEIDDETPSLTPVEEQLRIALSDTWTEAS
ncbi:exonuclease SbcCD subunit D [Streptomyces sp. NPDC058375]|uniref:metallophosphoesterase family protein n=1 Tax=Streptomyces sp. NPDC058375 TaxID=3346467 RepID=UPI00364E9CC8